MKKYVGLLVVLSALTLGGCGSCGVVDTFIDTDATVRLVKSENATFAGMNEGSSLLVDLVPYGPFYGGGSVDTIDPSAWFRSERENHRIRSIRWVVADGKLSAPAIGSSLVGLVEVEDTYLQFPNSDAFEEIAGFMVFSDYRGAVQGEQITAAQIAERSDWMIVLGQSRLEVHPVN